MAMPTCIAEVVVEFAVDHLLGGGLDMRRQLCVEVAELKVHRRGGFLDDAKRADDGDGLTLPADGEIHDRALGLCAPILVRRNL